MNLSGLVLSLTHFCSRHFILYDTAAIIIIEKCGLGRLLSTRHLRKIKTSRFSQNGDHLDDKCSISYSKIEALIVATTSLMGLKLKN